MQYLSFWLHELIYYQWQIGDREVSVLDEREIEGANGAVTQLLISCWVEEGIMRDILKLLPVSMKKGSIEHVTN